MRKFVQPKSNKRRSPGQKETPKTEFWKKVILEYRASHRSAEEFCKKNGLSLARLRYWTRTLKVASPKEKPSKKKTAPKQHSFLPAKIIAAPIKRKGHSLEIELHCGRVLRLHEDFEVDVLKKVIIALEELM